MALRRTAEFQALIAKLDDLSADMTNAYGDLTQVRVRIDQIQHQMDNVAADLQGFVEEDGSDD